MAFPSPSRADLEADAIAGDDVNPRPEPGTVDPARITSADPAWAGGRGSGGS